MVTECFASIQVVVEKIFLHLLSANFLETESADFILLPGICTGGKWSVHRHIYVYVCYAYMLISLSKIGDRESESRNCENRPIITNHYMMQKW